MLGYNEHEFVLNNIDIIYEFDTKSFQANAASYIKGDINNINFRTSYYSKTIADTIQSLKEITLDKEAVREFTNIKIHGNMNPIRPIDYSDVTVINTNYLTGYVEKIKSLVENSENLSRSGVEDTFNNEFYYTKKNMVKTTLNYRMPLADILGVKDSYKKIIPDDKYVTSTILPFVNGFEKTKNNLYQEGKELLVIVTEVENDINKIILTASNIKSKTSLDSRTSIQKIDYVQYNGIYKILDLLSYVTYMYIRKVNNFRTNVLNCNRLYIDIINNNSLTSVNESENGTVLNPGMISTTPANLGFNIMQGNVAAYEVLANKVYELYTGKNKVEDIDDVLRIGDDESSVTGEYIQGHMDYDPKIYLDIKKAFIGIGQGLYNICQIPDGLLVRKDDVIYDSGFKIPLKQRYRGQLDAITDISRIQHKEIANKYGIDKANINELLAEVKAYSSNMDMISKEVIDAYAILKEIERRFDLNINNEFKDLDSAKEIAEWAQIFEDEYVDFVNDIAGRFMQRLANLAITLKNIDDNGTPLSNTNDIVANAFAYLDVKDYTSLESSLYIDYKNTFNMIEFEVLERSYHILKTKEDTGCNLIFEADEEVEKPNEKAGFTQKFSTSSGNRIDNLSDKLSKMITSLINAFIENITKLKDNDTIKKVNSNANRIMNETDFNKIPAAQIYTYKPYAETLNAINAIKGNVVQITPQVIQSLNTKSDVWNKVFNFSGYKPTDKEDELASQILWYLKTGNASPSQPKTYQGEELRTIVQTDMIPFENAYITSFADDLKTALKALTDATNDTISKYKTVETTPANNQNNNQVTKESAFDILFEAEDVNKNTQTSMGEKAGWLIRGIEIYCRNVMKAIQDRHNDYIKILAPLIPADNTPNTNNTTI